MNNRQVLEQVDRGYRLPCPTRCGLQMLDCTNEIYEVMLQSWNRQPEKRPTFETLHLLFEDFFVFTESQYKEAPQ